MPRKGTQTSHNLGKSRLARQGGRPTVELGQALQPAAPTPSTTLVR